MGAQFGLDGRVALVTGASKGIGRGLAVGLAQAGADVAALGRDEAELRETVAAVQTQGRRAIAIVCDVRDSAGLSAAVERTERELGPLTLAVNNAGVAGSAAALTMPDTEWDRVMDTNLTGVFRCCRAEAAAMARNGGGAIVNIASISGSIANPGLTQAHYNASKAAVIHLSKSLAVEWVDAGIRVNVVSPGYTATAMNRRPEVIPLIEAFETQTPMGRLAEVEEMVGPTVFLLSPAASYVTGHDLLVDGGLTCW